MLTQTLLLLRIKIKGKGKGQAKGKGVAKDREKENRQTKENALVISLRRPGYVLTMHVSASARRTTAHFSMHPLASCVKPSAARQDRDLVRPLSDSDLRGLNVAIHREERKKVKAEVRASRTPCPRQRVMAKSTCRRCQRLLGVSYQDRVGAATT